MKLLLGTHVFLWLADAPQKLTERAVRLPEIDPTRILLYPPNMTVRPVQISMDNDLLGRIDSDPEAQHKGRSAFIRSAVRLYLKAKERREIEARLADAYAGEADALLEEIEALMGGQSWPTD